MLVQAAGESAIGWCGAIVIEFTTVISYLAFVQLASTRLRLRLNECVSSLGFVRGALNRPPKLRVESASVLFVPQANCVAMTFNEACSSFNEVLLPEWLGKNGNAPEGLWEPFSSVSGDKYEGHSSSC